MALFDTLTDSFIGTTIDTAKWTVFTDTGKTLTQNNGLEFGVPNTTGGINSRLTSVAGFNLTGSSIYWQAKTSVTTLPSTMTFELKQFGTFTNAVSVILRSNNKVDIYVTGGGSAINRPLTVRADKFVYLRIRELSNTIYLDQSLDARTWTNVSSPPKGSASITNLQFVVTGSTEYPATSYMRYVNTIEPIVISKSINATINYDMDMSYSRQLTRSISATINYGVSFEYTRHIDTSVPEEKLYLYKVYAPNGDYLGVIEDVINDPNYSQNINEAGSSMELELARNSDSVKVELEPLLDHLGNPILDNDGNEIMTSRETRNKVGLGSMIAHGNHVEVWCFYANELEGICKFQGFMAEIGTKYGGSENTTVQLMSYGYDLDNYLIEDSGDTTVSFLSVDPADIVRTTLTDLPTLSGGETYTTYTNATVPLTGTVVSYPFKVNTYKEMLDKSIQLSPQGQYYFIGLGDNLVRFKQKSSTADHTFILGKHIKELDLKSYSANAKNDLLFTGGGTPSMFRRYTRTPLDGTRRGLARMSDNRVTNTGSANIIANGELDEKEGIQYRCKLTILDKVYDIETIEVGDMVGYGAFDNYVDDLLMQVVGLDYEPDLVVLHLDTLPPAPSKRLEDLRRNLNQVENEDVPVAPTIVP